MGPSFFNDGDPVEFENYLLQQMASMGPSFFNDGDLNLGLTTDPADELQWGRRSSTTETRTSRRKRNQHHLASMGPSFFNDGDVTD